MQADGLPSDEIINVEFNVRVLILQGIYDRFGDSLIETDFRKIPPSGRKSAEGLPEIRSRVADATMRRTFLI